MVLNENDQTSYAEAQFQKSCCLGLQFINLSDYEKNQVDCKIYNPTILSL